MTGAWPGFALLAHVGHWVAPVGLAFDAAIEPVSRVTGSSPPLLFVAVVVVEALLLWLFRWGSPGRSALASFVMNAVSALVGAQLDLRMPDALVYGFLLSAPIEAAVLLLFDRRRKLRALVSALGTNVASYALLIGVYVFGRSFF